MHTNSRHWLGATKVNMEPVHSPAASRFHCRKPANNQTTPKATEHTKTQPNKTRFKDFYLGLKVAASLDRTESFIKTIEGQVRCITAVYHSLRREKIKCRNSRTAMGVKSLRPTWFEDETVAKTAAEPMHGLRLIIKGAVLPLSDHPKSAAEVAKRGLLAPETWHCNRTWKPREGMSYSKCGTTTKSTTRKTSSSYETTTDDILRGSECQPDNPQPVCPTVGSFEN